MFQLDFHPFSCVHVEHNHILADHSIFSLATVHNHASLIDRRRMILPRANTDSLRLHHLNTSRRQIILQYLIGALSDLPLPVKLETAAKYIQLLLVVDRGVTLSAQDLLLRLERRLLPDDGLAHYAGADDLFDWLLVHATDHVCVVTVRRQGGRLTRRRDPALALGLDPNFGAESFSLLHTLHERLDTPC